MKSITKPLICGALIVMGLLLCSCGILSNLNDAVQYPEAYTLSYEVTSENGTVTTITKTVDENGNIYYRNADTEIAYIAEGSSYIKYEKKSDGSYSKMSSNKLTKKAVENETAGIKTYAEESKKQFMPTAKQENDAEMLGRACEVYKLGVGTENNSSYTYYYVDKETGICLGVETHNTALGESVAYNGEGFTCIEFSTENIADISNMINE